MSLYLEPRLEGFLTHAGQDDHAKPVLRGDRFQPEIEFTAASGETVSYPQGGLVAGWQAGDAVPVRYDPTAPARDPCIDRAAAIWTVPAAFLFAGLVTVAAAWAAPAHPGTRTRSGTR